MSGPGLAAGRRDGAGRPRGCSGAASTRERRKLSRRHGRPLPALTSSGEGPLARALVPPPEARRFATRSRLTPRGRVPQESRRPRGTDRELPSREDRGPAGPSGRGWDVVQASRHRDLKIRTMQIQKPSGTSQRFRPEKMSSGQGHRFYQSRSAPRSAVSWRGIVSAVLSSLGFLGLWRPCQPAEEAQKPIYSMVCKPRAPGPRP